MAQFGAPNFLGVIDAYEAGSRRAERNRLAELDNLGRELQGKALGGDQNALARLGQVNPQAYMQTQQFTSEQKKQRLGEFLSAAYGAKTPEQWNSVVQRFKAQGHQFGPGEEDFGNRENLIRQGMSVADQMGYDWRQTEAKRDQRNSDRSYSLDERQFQASRSDADRNYELARDRLDQKADPYGERAGAAAQYGLKPGTPEYQTFVLTGNTPQEQRSTASDRAAIREADDMAFSAKTAIGQLKEALALNDQAGSGMFAGAQAFAARNDPTGIFDDKKGEATTNFNNLVMNQALGSLKAIFGGNPTEGERAILLDLQASADKTPAERKAILNRAVALAEKRMAFNQDRANELRSGTYYQPKDAGPGPGPGGSQQQGAVPAAPGNADALIEQANDAIRRGADPAKVRARLLEQGVEADFGE